MKKIKLGDLLTIKHGYAFKSEHYLNDGNFALVTLANISESNNFQFDKEKLTYYGASFPQDVILKEGDLILPMTEQVIGLLGNSAFIPAVDGFSFVLNQRVGKVIPSSNVDKYYLHYLLATKEVKTQLEYRASGTKQRNISPENIYDVTVLVPDLPSQKKIGSVLYSLEQKINLNKKINATLEAMAKTLYDYWFMQFDFPDENGKPYKTSGGKMIYNAKLGRDIPVDWEVDTLEGKISITRGISYSTETLSAGTEGMPMINLASVDRKRNYIPSGLKFFIGDVPNEKKLQARDMLIACTDLTRQAEIIGSPILVMDDREYTFSMDLAKLTVIDEKLNELYLYMTLRTNFYHQYIVGFASGTTVLHLNTNGIEWYKVLIPPAVLQKKFAVVMNNIYLQTCKNICESQRLAELRDWMLPMLMNGQIKF